MSVFDDIPEPVMVRVSFSTSEDTRERIEQAGREDMLARGEWIDLTRRDVLDRCDRKARRSQHQDEPSAA